MKKFTLLVGLLGVMTVSFGQVRQLASDIPAIRHQGNQDFSVLNPIKGGGDVIWSTSFDWEDPSSERGWTLPDGWAITDEADLGCVWRWNGDTINQYWTVGQTGDSGIL